LSLKNRKHDKNSKQNSLFFRCSSADQAKGASPCKVCGLVEIPTAATQKSAMSVEARMGRFTLRDEPLVCSSAYQAKGASPCKVGGLVEIPTAAT